MKKLSFLIAFLMFFYIIDSSVQAQTLVLSEDFNYPTGDLLTDHEWTAHSGGGTNAIAVAEGSLSYLNYIHSGIGNKAILTGNGEDVNKAFPDTFNAANSVAYAAFMINVTSASSNSDYFAHFMGQNATSIAGRVFIKSAGTGFQIGLSKSGAATTAIYDAQTFNYGETYLLVLKYQIKTGNTNDSSFLFINPIVGNAEPLPDITADITGTDPTYIQGFGLRQSASTPVVSVDGIRVAKTWEEAVKYLAFPASLNVSPATLSFDSLLINSSSSAQTITVTATNLTGNITHTLAGSGAAAFQIAETSWNSTQGGLLNVIFTPLAAINYEAMLIIAAPDVDNDTVFLSGKGFENTEPLLPIADFTVSTQSIELADGETGSINFENLSEHADSYVWIFEGGIPATSTESHPVVTYTAEGTYNVTLVAINEFGSDTMFKENYITVVIIDAVSENELSLQSKLYPNPSHGSFTLETEENSNIHLYNLYGQLLLTQTVGAKEILKLENFHAGSYILKITNPLQQVAYKKIIKQ